jgi:PAS domain S-box-containing protein
MSRPRGWLRFILGVVLVTTIIHTLLLLIEPTWTMAFITSGVWLTALGMSIREYRKSTALSARELDIWLKIGLDLILMVNPKEEILRASGGWFQALGYEPRDLVGRRWSEFVHPDDVQPAQEAAESILQGLHLTQYVNRWRHRSDHPTGEPRWVWLEWSGLQEGDVIFATARLSAVRLEHESLMAMWSRVSTDLMATTDAYTDLPTRQFQWVNDAWTKTLGWSLAEVYQTTFFDLLHPEDRIIAMNRNQARLQGLLVDPIVVYRLQAKTSKQDIPIYRWFEWRSVVLEGKNYGSGRDITIERQNHEFMTHVIRDLEKSNADLERFASIAAHQLRSPPRTILGVARALEEDYKTVLDAPGQQFLQDIQENAAQMSEIVNGLYRFSKVRTIEELEMQPVDLNVVVTAIRDTKTKQGCFSEGHRQLIVESLPKVLGDSVLLQEVLMNLIDNGFKFNQSKVSIVHVSANLRPDGRWDIHVADNGIGIDPKYHRKLFQMFQRVHPTYQGTGVGLALVAAIVQKMGGTILVDSKVNAGSTFTFDLEGA